MTDEIFRLFVQRRNTYSFKEKKQTFDEDKKNKKLVGDNISMKVEATEYLTQTLTVHTTNRKQQTQPGSSFCDLRRFKALKYEKTK